MHIIGKLGIIINADIPVSYLAQSIFLNEETNVFTYIGIVLVFVCVFCIFYAQWKDDNDNYNNIDNDIEMVDNNQLKDDNIDDVNNNINNTKNNTRDIAFYDWKFGYNERHLELTRMDIDNIDKHTRLM